MCLDSRGGKFSSKVLYIYRKQLEEADIIVINKIDLLDERQLSSLREALAAEFPTPRSWRSPHASHGISKDWFEQITSRAASSRSDGS